ncbi:uncharacterized protein O3C94_007585 [Discoglossus pictus]
MSGILVILLALWCSCHARHIYDEPTTVQTTTSVQSQALNMAEEIYTKFKNIKKPTSLFAEPDEKLAEKVLKRAINDEDLHIDLAPSESPFPARELVTVTEQETKPAINLPHKALELAKRIYSTFQKMKSPESVVEETGFSVGQSPEEEKAGKY